MKLFLFGISACGKLYTSSSAAVSSGYKNTLCLGGGAERGVPDKTAELQYLLSLQVALRLLLVK